MGPRHGPPCPPDPTVTWLVLRVGSWSHCHQLGGQQWCGKPQVMEGVHANSRQLLLLSGLCRSGLNFILHERRERLGSQVGLQFCVRAQPHQPLCPGSPCRVSIPGSQLEMQSLRPPPSPESASALVASARPGIGDPITNTSAFTPELWSQRRIPFTIMLSIHTTGSQILLEIFLQYNEKNVYPFFPQGCPLETSPLFNGRD